MPGERPLGRDELAAGLSRLGLRRGQDLIVHCSMWQIGWVEGGPATLLAAIADVAGPDATIVVPAQTLLNSVTSSAFRSATAYLTGQEYDEFIVGMPGFDPLLTPSTGMGAFAEHVRTRQGACRSAHPLTSFAALGPAAAACTAVHDLTCHLGEQSPLGWLYAADAAILLLGVGYSACTAFHLAEYRITAGQRTRRYHCYLSRDGMREPCEFTGIEHDDGDFAELGAALDETAMAAVAADQPVGVLNAGNAPRHGKVGAAQCTMLPIRTAVDFACTWMASHRK